MIAGTPGRPETEAAYCRVSEQKVLRLLAHQLRPSCDSTIKIALNAGSLSLKAARFECMVELTGVGNSFPGHTLSPTLHRIKPKRFNGLQDPDILTEA